MMGSQNETDKLDDFLDLLENGSDSEEPSEAARSSEPESENSRQKKALDDLTYEDIFGSPEKKRQKINGSSDKSKIESCNNSVMSQLGSRPVAPEIISSTQGTTFDTSQILIDSFSRLRLYKTSVTLYHDPGTSIESALKERNFGLEYISLLNFPLWYKTKGAHVKNFWTSGVLVRKQAGVRKSAKGNEYAVWEVNDLKQLDKCWTIFLFSSAVSAPSLSAVKIGALIDITTPSVLESNKGGSGSMKLSINNSNQIRPVGTSKDFGFCQSKRKDGKDCTAVVNTWECCTCIHHAASELRKMSGGSSRKKSGVSFGKETLFDRPPPMRNHQGEGIKTVNFGKPPPAVTLPKPVGSFGKNHGSWISSASKGTYTSPQPPINMPQKGFSRMELQGTGICNELKRTSINRGNASSISFKVENNDILSKLPPKPIVAKASINFDLSKSRHLTEKDRLLLSALRSPPKKTKENETGKKSKNNKSAMYSEEIVSRIVSNPTAGSLNFMRYLTGNEKIEENEDKSKSNVHDTRKKESEPVSMNRETIRNMKKALDFVKLNGAIKKANPNALKRKAHSLGSNTSNSTTNSSKTSKKSSKGGIEVEFDFKSEEFQKILNAKSVHEEHTSELAQEEYFGNLVKKEAIENKLLNTFSVATNAVMCKVCKYIAVGQSEYCKELQHQIRVVKATKRFFKCKDCGNRTMSLDRLPKHACKQCNSSSWITAPVGKERKGPVLPTEVLSIRGNEEKFIGSSSSSMYLNLEVS